MDGTQNLLDSRIFASPPGHAIIAHCPTADGVHPDKIAAGAGAIAYGGRCAYICASRPCHSCPQGPEA